MEKSILVTIFVVTYKKFASIYCNLRSILDQDYPMIELIVSDDGSDNFPQQEIERYIIEHQRGNIKEVQIVANPANVGTVKHINHVLSLSHGELFLPLSGDDIFLNSHVVSEIVSEYKKTNFNVLSTSRVAVDSQGKKKYLYPHYLERFVIRKKMKTATQQYRRLMQGRFNHYASGSTMYVKTDFLRMIGGHDERFVLWEDGPFIAKLTRLGYKIDFRLDLVTIKYGLGGVSTGGAHGRVLELLGADFQQFVKDKRDCKKSIDHRLTRRFIEYDEHYEENKGLFKNVIWKLKYFDVFLLNRWKIYFEKIAMGFDKFYLKYFLKG